MMTERIKEMKKFFVTDKRQKESWQNKTDQYALARTMTGKSDIDRAAIRLKFVLDNETPVVYPFEKIAFTRTIQTIPELFTEEEMQELSSKFHIHEKGDVCNINVDYSILMKAGFAGTKQKLEALISNSSDERKKHYWSLQIDILDSVLSLMKRYVKKAEETNNITVRDTIEYLLEKPPVTLLQAMQMFRIIHFTMWAGRNYHNTIGRFDQLFYPYYKHDLDCGVLNDSSTLELVEEFFLSFNRDSDLYPGMQQGDNGQSLVLGGYDLDGNDMYNEFSDIAMQASLDLHLIDPKINLRVNSKTPLDRYILGTHMTKQGLGFPQYSNDDVVVKGLIDLGYRPEDAINYVVAACWEFIIPGKAMDIPNIAAFSFAESIRKNTIENLSNVKSFKEFLNLVDMQINKDANALLDSIKEVYIFPAPFITLMIDGAVEKAKDISLGADYNNYGIHGTGIATAVDSLAEIKEHVFDKKDITAEELIKGLETNFESNERMGNILRYDKEKLGNDTESTNTLAAHILSTFAAALKERKNERDGIYRPGTGSAMYYIWHSAELGATPDGRKKGEVIPANYSPSLFSRVDGPVSIIKSFAYPDLTKVINGGPLTIEIHDTVFRNDESIEKVARLIKTYIDLGGHQLQINTVNRDTLLDAQKHPENYRNLIVRVWGWSGYFVELDKCYQDHIIARIELAV